MYKQLLLSHIIIVCSFFAFNGLLYIFFPNLFFYHSIILTISIAGFNLLSAFIIYKIARKKTAEKEKMFISIIANGVKFLTFLIISLIFVKVTPSKNHTFLALYLLFMFIVYSILEIKNATKKV